MLSVAEIMELEGASTATVRKRLLAAGFNVQAESVFFS
jgi:hypothetical protein